jgi:hypothetical protein
MVWSLSAGLVTLATVSAVIGLGAEPAAAKTMYASLTIKPTPEPNSGGRYRVTVKVDVPMNLYDANGYINNGATVGVTFRGDDAGNDAFNILELFPEGPTHIWARNSPGLYTDVSGIHLRYTFLAPGSELDEDSGPLNHALNNFRDEIFYNATFTDVDGGASSVRSNVVVGYFCCA